MPQNTRREIIGAGAAAGVIAGAGLPMGVTMAKGEPGQLAGLVSRYFAEVDVFNATAHQTDEESDAHAESTCLATLRRIIGTPARTADDALAAMDWLIKENADFKNELGDTESIYGRAVTSLVDALRGYIASTAEARS